MPNLEAQATTAVEIVSRNIPLILACYRAKFAGSGPGQIANQKFHPFGRPLPRSVGNPKFNHFYVSQLSRV